MGWFEEGGSSTPLDVAELVDGKWTAMLWELVGHGALVSVGLTSDGGALGVTITVDGRWRREYFRDAEAAHLWFEEAMAPVIEACDARRASSEPRTRSRRSRGA